MEIVVSILWHLVRWLDGLSQKRLRQAVPDIDQLLANPADYFSYQEITIRPWRRWASGVVLGLLLSVGLVMIGSFIFSLIVLALVAVNPAGPAPNSLVVVIFAVVVMVMPLGGLLLGMYWVRGGTCILNSAGVRLIHGGVEVFCPWSLFSAPGQPIIHPLHTRNRFELPVAAAAVPLVEARRNDFIIAQGMAVKTRQTRFRSPQEVILRNLYRVKPDELSWLLLQLGRSLGLSSSTLKKLPAQTHYQSHFQAHQPTDDSASARLPR